MCGRNQLRESGRYSHPRPASNPCLHRCTQSCGPFVSVPCPAPRVCLGQGFLSNSTYRILYTSKLYLYRFLDVYMLFKNVLVLLATATLPISVVQTEFPVLFSFLCAFCAFYAHYRCSLLSYHLNCIFLISVPTLVRAPNLSTRQHRTHLHSPPVLVIQPPRTHHSPSPSHLTVTTVSLSS